LTRGDVLTPGPPRSVGIRLFALSFAALFLELMVIRWVPSEVRLVAYYANLMLISSFLGLGIGAMLSTRGWRLFRLFPPLFALNILHLILLGNAVLPDSGGEFRFIYGDPSWAAYMILVPLFVVNAAAFVPLGEEIGVQFHRMPALHAYSWDLGGSLAGTVAFGAFSLLYFSPLLGMGFVAVLVWTLEASRRRLLDLGYYAAAIGGMLLAGNQQDVQWSPYYFITVEQNASVLDPVAGATRLGAAQDPSPHLLTMANPPLYTVRVNQDFYQVHGTIDLDRYDPDAPEAGIVRGFHEQYSLPYRLIDAPERVLVLGSGGGMDVEMALMQGASHVDAVEIDPVIPRISQRWNAGNPYGDPRVTLHVTDARAFLQRNDDTYDLIAFGYLDSQALFSYGSSLRLDGYTYTVESFRTAFGHLVPGGVLSVAFAVGEEWLGQRLEGMMREATGADPVVYVRNEGMILAASRGPWQVEVPDAHGGFERTTLAGPPVPLATDDWPYLYLKERSIPPEYLVVIGLLLLVSVLAVVGFRGTSLGWSDSHFFFMGWGFLLLQTKAIGDCALYFGSTWLVTTLVITGVLLMVLLANLVAIRYLRFSPWLYLPLFASLLVLFVPRDLVLATPLFMRVLWTILAVPLPIFFAGLIFSTTFRISRNPSAALGANLVGATVGGFCEYLSMAIGTQGLGFIVIAAYVASFLSVRLWSGDRGSLFAPAAPPSFGPS
jgi:hypothetical protein